MTRSQFREYVAQFQLAAPVTIEDLRELHADIKMQLPVGVPLDVVLRGSRVEITVGGGGPAPETEWINVA